MKKEALSESVLTKLFTPSKSNSDYIHGRESTTIEYKEAGISLSYTPIISKQDEITAKIEDSL